MSFSPDVIGSKEWNAFPKIEELVDPHHTPHPERLLNGKLNMVQAAGLTAGSPEVWPTQVLEGFRSAGLVLDVACGVLPHYRNKKTFGRDYVERWAYYPSPVGVIANAYGIDPALEFFTGNALEERTLPAYAEDLPFKDEVFGLTLSTRGVGWHTGTAFDPYWSIREMVRVTAPEGLVLISIGSGASMFGTAHRTRELVSDAISRIQAEDFGQKRIAHVKDFSGEASPQINLRLK